MSAQAYGSAVRNGGNERQIEAEALLRAARLLQGFIDAFTEDGLPEALAHNRRLWIAIATAVLDDANRLPVEIKSNIANLANFVFQRTNAILAEPSPAKIQVLVSINRNIAAGLLAE